MPHDAPDLSRDEQGEAAFAAAAHALTQAELAAPSLLPGWSRAHVIAHVAGNAAAFARAVAGGAEGKAVPMYESRALRDAEIEERAAWPAADLLELLDECTRSLTDVWHGLTPAQWDLDFVNGQGARTSLRSSVVARVREVWIHLVDLDSPAEPGGMDLLPADVAEAVLREVFGLWQARDAAASLAITTTASDGASLTLGAAEDDGVTLISGALSDVAAWATGRTAAGSSAPTATRGGVEVPLQAAPAWV